MTISAYPFVKGFSVGTVGFSYEGWARSFYPPATKPAQRLTAYAREFDFVELDTTFYALPSADRVQVWRDSVPAHFRFAFKAPQVLSHESLQTGFATDANRALWGQTLQVAQGLGWDQTTILLQLPPGFKLGLWDDLLRLLQSVEIPPRLAIEFRHESLHHPEVIATLRAKNWAWVNADLVPVGEADRSPDVACTYMPLSPTVTADWGYLRLCGRHDQYESESVELQDSTPRLTWWLDKLSQQGGQEIDWVASCGNSFAGHGPATARRLIQLTGQIPTPPLQPDLFG